MTTPTLAEVGHRSKEPTGVEIDGFRGRLISADHADYDIARAVWNGAIDRRPRLIARCMGAADVVRAVRFARDHDLEIAIRGGGHNVAGTAICDDGIVIDLSAMRAVRVDPADRRAWVQGGALWGDVDNETQAHGLATTGGIVSHTGVGGLTLGGGVGWLMRKHGLTVDNLLAVDVVTADGELLRVSKDEHPDLFWALRGGGGNFGVATSFEFRLHPVGPTVLAGPILWDAADAKDVLRFYRDFLRGAPDELGTVVRFGTAPPLPVIPEKLHWRPVLMIGTCYAGLIADGERVLRPLRACRSPLLDLVGPAPYVGFQSAIDSTVVHGWNYYLEVHPPPRAARRSHRRDRRARVLMLVVAVVRGDVPSEGGGEPSDRRRHGVREPAGVARDHSRRCVAAWRGLRRPGHRLDKEVLRRPWPFPPRRLRQLPRRRRRPRPGARGLRRLRLRPAGSCEDHVRPRQRLPPQSEHPPEGYCRSRPREPPAASLRLTEADRTRYQFLRGPVWDLLRCNGCALVQDRNGSGLERILRIKRRKALAPRAVVAGEHFLGGA